jgi:hypothetical protein
VPLPASSREAGTSLLAKGLPATTYSLDRDGTTVTVTGNLTVRASLTLDTLGQPSHDALLHVTTGTPAAGDELEQFVVWGEHPGGLRARWGLRWKPAFHEFTTVSRTAGTDDPETGIPGADTVTTGSVDLALLPGRVTVTPSGDGTSTRRTATALARTAPGIGLEVTNATFGSYRVTSVTPYGPWYAVQLEGSQ